MRGEPQPDVLNLNKLENFIVMDVLELKKTRCLSNRVGDRDNRGKNFRCADILFLLLSKY